MALFKKDKSGSERRKYIRMDTVFPVQFRFMSLLEDRFISEWVQGFTNNIGRGGLCLRVNNLTAGQIGLIREGKIRLALEIDMPFSQKPLKAKANIAWLEESQEDPQKFLVGLSYQEIDTASNKKIMGFAKARMLFVPVISAVIIILGLGLGINSYLNYKLVKGNKALVEQLVGILQESSVAKQKIKQFNKEREDLKLKIQALEVRLKTIDDEKATLSEKVKQEEYKAVQKTGELNELIGKLTKEKSGLQERLIAFQQKENNVAEELLRLDQKRVTLEKANLDKMYRWLSIHQNHRTGLVMSFEGDADVSNWAFIYDQSLVIQAFTQFSDYERAKKVLDFFERKPKKAGGMFINAYYATDGSAAEYTVHCGPNLWLGIAILQYTKKSQDTKYLHTAEEIAQTIIQLQNEDPEGGLRGGPDVTWYATEHNLDAYAFFNMLFAITNKSVYSEARDKVLKWLVSHTYDKSEVPIMRGKGDSTIATDTYAWSIAAVGPQKLEELGMNPDKIMEFAEQNCAVEVTFLRPEGQQVIVKGFDFAPQRHVSRGGLISPEWTAQMILSFKIMADFYHQKGMDSKSKVYEEKADNYLLDLCNLIISSPSPSGQGEGCLPYATLDSADTGHGWMTPKGKYTGSVAGTAYTLFAYSNYNPLELKE